ncbi:sigma-70 family RNA polymerase sigma factor [Sphingomonas sp.]|uniref:RNA polymerase sigma factor n=1 Tax=Sphingomonas sp. TaxID=28214 RepID=UPI0025CCF37D|nr:sigma-70 family RNA polymerase sigma factor [Sphingomonas sp.]
MNASRGATVQALHLSRELEAAYTESHAGLVRFLATRLDSRHHAEDLAQDLFLALPRLSCAEPVRSPKSLLFRIARNLAINFNGQETRRAEIRAANADVLWTAVDEVTPERHLLGQEALDAINAAIEALPERTRQILAWRRLEGCRNVDIAARLGISTTAVEKHLRHAMTELVAAIDALSSEG